MQANAFIVATAAAITGGSLLVATDRLAVDSVQMRRINAANAPLLDGDTSDRAWRGVKPFSLLTGEGGNFDGKGEARIEIRAGCASARITCGSVIRVRLLASSPSAMRR